MIDKPPRIALLIDADNSPSAKIGLILNELSTYGETSIRRAYGNWKKQELRGWEELLHEHAIRPMQQFDYSKGKNASDMAMVIDALDLLYSDQPEAFGIVSSDADFTPLVMYLRAKGAAVYGFGAQKTPEPFVNACSRFLYLDKLAVTAAAVDIDTGELTRDESGGTPLRVPAAKLKRDAKLVGLLRNAVEAAAGESGWARVGAVGQQIGNQASFDPRNYGYSRLGLLVEDQNYVDAEHPEGGQPRVRLRSQRPPRKRTATKKASTAKG